MFWLNVDFPNQTCTLHREHCNRRPRKEPKYKGFRVMKRDGGWLSFATDAEAETYYRGERQGKGYKWVRCSYCRL
jgi:hypothetical protein